MLPHELTKQAEDKTAQLQWDDYVAKLRASGSLSSALAVCDVSGSMAGTPMDVAIALSILISQVTEAPFDNLVCSFSQRPQLFKLPPGSLDERIKFLKRMEWGMNTNFQAVFDLVLDQAQEAKLPSEKMIKTVFVFSDMGFDCASTSKTDHEEIKLKFGKAGYVVPRLVYWNLRGDRETCSKPALKSQNNVVLVSGYSGQLVRQFLENKLKTVDPMIFMIDSLKFYQDLDLCD